MKNILDEERLIGKKSMRGRLASSQGRASYQKLATLMVFLIDKILSLMLGSLP